MRWGDLLQIRIIIKKKRRRWARCTAASRATFALPVSPSGAVCKCFAIKSVGWRMTGTFDAAWLFSGVPAESYFHRMLCMHFSDRLLQETGSSGGEQTRLEWITTPSRQNEAKHNSGRGGKEHSFIQSVPVFVVLLVVVFLLREPNRSFDKSLKLCRRCKLTIQEKVVSKDGITMTQAWII